LKIFFQETIVMDNSSVIEVLGQAEFGSAGEIFRDYIRTTARGMILDVMGEELERLCGPRYRPDSDSEFIRSGTAEGYVYIEADREQITRPRVRHENPDGTTSEVQLKSYAAAQDRSEFKRLILNSILAAGSQSKTGKVVNNQRGSSASQISRIFQQHGRERFAELRRRRLDCDDNGECYDWLALMVDGVVLSKDITAVVAVGITTRGDKIVLDFEIGSSESYEVALALVKRVQNRGFAPPEDRPLLAILDGSEALRKAVKAIFATSLFQRCLIHKERNLRRYLARKDWATMTELMDRLRKAQGPEAGILALCELDEFLAGKNSSARDSLHESGLDLITVHLLDVPATLNSSLTNTNMIENVIHNFRRTSSRVCRWQAQTDQAARWLATGLTEAEKGFRKVSNSRDLPILAEALESGCYYAALEEYQADLPEAFRAAAAASLRAAPSASQQQPLTTNSE
jgi:putative transposase